MTEELTSPARVLVHAVEAPASDRRSDRTAEDLAESAGERAQQVMDLGVRQALNRSGRPRMAPSSPIWR